MNLDIKNLDRSDICRSGRVLGLSCGWETRSHE